MKRMLATSFRYIKLESRNYYKIPKKNYSYSSRMPCDGSDMPLQIDRMLLIVLWKLRSVLLTA